MLKSRLLYTALVALGTLQVAAELNSSARSAGVEGLCNETGKSTSVAFTKMVLGEDRINPTFSSLCADRSILSCCTGALNENESQHNCSRASGSNPAPGPRANPDKPGRGRKPKAAHSRAANNVIWTKPANAVSITRSMAQLILFAGFERFLSSATLIVEMCRMLGVIRMRP
ncbi:hypothetical protein B0H16DRAFT_1483371 [Mycena metata]|uniref:Hydrophobin n=1 Tax=Mycena metata TaxID=1033252 RepID=A0AAD7GPP8_9AGAR|nr:hypothetical protein B0H16DRAFT_1483371 [Mycena metata]